MKRIDILYGGQIYSVGGRALEDLRAEIESGLAGDRPAWIIVNDGEGELRPAHLLLQRGVPISLIPIPDGPEQ